MASNPALVQAPVGRCPAAFPGEAILCRRDGICFEIDGLQAPSRRWKANGVLYLSSMRMVFVAEHADPATGLESFDLPLVYLVRDKFNQPFFGANNLSGECWPAVQGGGPSGALPPHKWTLTFNKGGVGTFLPLYFTYLTGARQEAHKSTSQAPPAPVDTQVGQAFVDPNDPTTVFISQPFTEDQRLASGPRYAPNYGDDEAYLPIV